MSGVLKYCYRVSKPRIQTTNIKNLAAYKIEMHEARLRLHKESTAYLNKIEDEFLQGHRKLMDERHFNNACKFRSLISRHSYQLLQELDKEKARHEERLQRIERFVREEEVKKLNRDRIKKILEYESKEAWLEGDKINEQLISEWVLPQYIGSTEYYHKLHTQALAYDQLDLDLLHRLSSDEEATQYKNRLLIPVYKELLILIKEAKFNEEEKAGKEYERQIVKLSNQYKNNQARLTQQLDIIKIQFEKNLVEIRERNNKEENKKEILFKNLQQLAFVFKKWKQYTDILSLTSNEILVIIGKQNYEGSISDRRKVLEKEIEKNRDRTFVDVVEEDTEDEEVPLAQFLERNAANNEVRNPEPTTDAFDEFNDLIKGKEQLLMQMEKDIEEEEAKVVKANEKDKQENEVEDLKEFTLNDELIVSEKDLVKSETTLGVEFLKEEFNNDKNMIKLLNIIGEISVEYPKLFKKIWDSQRL